MSNAKHAGFTTPHGVQRPPEAADEFAVRKGAEWAGAQDARRSRLRLGLPERIEDPAGMIAILAALLLTARSIRNQESNSDDTKPAA